MKLAEIENRSDEVRDELLKHLRVLNKQISQEMHFMTLAL